MDEPVAESSIGNSYEAPRTRRRAVIEASIKSLGTEPSQSTIQAVKRLRSEMMTRENKKLQRRLNLHLM